MIGQVTVSARPFRQRAGLLWLAFSSLSLLFLVPVAVLVADDPSSRNPIEPPITADQREHWAYRAVTRPTIPSVEAHAWCSNPVDAFILDRIERAGFRPAEDANRATSIRRLTLDLTGLPPAMEDVAGFLQDDRPDAYERVVDRLLASPAHGERMAQHWLDLARFAETDGFEHDKVRPEAWRYRDWVIAAFNADLPYDEFVSLQLAADELQPDDDRSAAALGFLTCGPDMPDINLQDERRHAFLNEIAGTVGSTLLGLQFGCAACHDHKYDAISQHDFYRLRAYFDRCFEFARDKPARFGPKSDVRPVSYLMLRGDFRRPGPEVLPAPPRIVADANASITTRAALAEWITRPDQPLATRVIANRLWQWHFGRGLAAAGSDLGVMGFEPTHPELLDWLATELPRQDFSLKSMHRLLVTSATYRQASRGAGEDDGPWRRRIEQDPENRLWSRMPRRRLSGEEIRDAMLAVSGDLSRVAGGPGVRPPLPQELLVTLLKDQWPVSPSEADHQRRSVYVFARRNLRFPIFEAFDKPETNASCPQRHLSTSAPQALLLLNSDFSQRVARRLAEVAVSARDDPRGQIDLLSIRLLGRSPGDEERAAALALLQQAANNQELAAEALETLCLALLNLNEFVYVD